MAPKRKLNHTTGADPTMPWHGWDPILKKLRLKDLRRNGYIDTDKAWKPIDRRVAIPTDQEVFDDIDNDALHPVFKQANWKGITDQDFARLRPALRLASNLLFEPTILQFFTGLMRTPLPEITNFPLATAKYGKLRKFTAAPPYGKDKKGLEEAVATWKSLSKLQDYVQWEFGENNRGAWGVTAAMDGWDPKYPVKKGFTTLGTWSTITTLETEFLEVIRGNILALNFPKARDFDQTAARLRTFLLLAITIVHELCHSIALVMQPEKTIMQPKRNEPFFNDQRLAELGNALETFIFGYLTYPMGSNCRTFGKRSTGASAAAPYGMFMNAWPAVDYEPRKPTLASAVHWSASGTVISPIKQADIHKFFTQRFWSQQVPQNNIAVMKWNAKVVLQVLPENLHLSPGETSPRDLEPSWPELSTDDDIWEFGFKEKDYDTDCDSEDSGDEYNMIH